MNACIHNVVCLVMLPANLLRERMRQKEVKIPYVPTRELGDVDLTAELNVEKYELMKSGHVGFSHRQGTHDDIFWALALGVYAAVQAPRPFTAADVGLPSTS